MGSLGWVLRGSELSELGAELRGLQWGWVALAVAADILVFVLHGCRWSVLLKPVEWISPYKSIRAVYVGLFANEVLPFRTGEVIRCYLQARWSSMPFSVALASAVTERVMDGLWLIVGLVIVMKRVHHLPKSIVEGGNVLGVVVLVLAALLVAVMLEKNWAHRRLSERGWQGRVRVLIDDLNLIGLSRYLGYAMLASLPYLLMQIVPIWATMKAYDLEDTRLGIAAATMVILRMSSVVPQAPGNIGLFHAAAAMSLQMFGYDPAFAKRFSLVLWAVVTLPLLIGGSIALVLTGSRLGELLHHANAESEARKAGGE